MLSDNFLSPWVLGNDFIILVDDDKLAALFLQLEKCPHFLQWLRCGDKFNEFLNWLSVPDGTLEKDMLQIGLDF